MYSLVPHIQMAFVKKDAEKTATDILFCIALSSKLGIALESNIFGSFQM